MKHTPGPWEIEGDTNDDVSIVNRNIDTDDWDIAIVHSGEANAKLIAQAPAMYEFIKKIADMKLCAEDRVHCESQSGPYCGAHDFFISDEEIIEARKLLDTENPTS